MDSFIEMILSRHSIREFTGEPIANSALELIVKAGMAAPSAVNVQPWSFIVITKKEILLSLCRMLPYAKMLNTAAAAIIVCGIPKKDENISERYWVFDCSAATENILLAAHSLNYGAVWTAVYPEEDRIESVRKECHIPEDIIPLNVIPIGIPKKTSNNPINKYKQENVHCDTW